MDAIDFNIYESYKTQYHPHNNKTVSLLETPHFTTNLLQLDKILEKDYEELDSFVIFICTEGSGDIHYGSEMINFKKGECILIPATLNKIRISPKGEIKLLEVYIV
jgi:mannose-6-phosphate isomerase